MPIDYQYVFDDDSRLDGWFTDFVPGFKHYQSNHMQTHGRNPAKALFEFLGGDSGNLEQPRPPKWEVQPESVQDVFIRATQPGSRFYHYGLNKVFATRKDLTYYTFTPMTGRDSYELQLKLKGNRSPYKPSEGDLALQRISALENEMTGLKERFLDKEERRNEADKIKLKLQLAVKRIEGKVSGQIVLELRKLYDPTWGVPQPEPLTGQDLPQEEYDRFVKEQEALLYGKKKADKIQT